MSGDKQLADGTMRSSVKAMSTNRLQFLVKLAAEELQRRISKLERALEAQR